MTSDSVKHEEESHLMFKFQDSIFLLYMYIGAFFFFCIFHLYKWGCASYLEALTIQENIIYMTQNISKMQHYT